MRPHVAALAIAVLAAGTALAQLPALHAEDNGLAVDFTVTTPNLIDIRGFAAKAAFTNQTGAEIKIDGLSLAPAQLALEFRDASGARVPHCPPPVPPADPNAGQVTLKPHQTESLDYHASICIALRPGRYQVRLRYTNSDASRGDWVGTLATDWADYTLR